MRHIITIATIALISGTIACEHASEGMLPAGDAASTDDGSPGDRPDGATDPMVQRASQPCTATFRFDNGAGFVQTQFAAEFNQTLSTESPPIVHATTCGLVHTSPNPQTTFPPTECASAGYGFEDGLIRVFCGFRQEQNGSVTFETRYTTAHLIVE